MKKTQTIKCDGCGHDFEKEIKYIKAAVKKNRGNYCSLSCAGKHKNINNLPGDSWNKSKENIENLKRYNHNRKNEFSPFRTLLASCKKRNKECNLDLLYLKELWESQNGICPVTKVKLEIKPSHNKNYQASIDRIDSSIGYLKGNVRFTSVSVNWLKSNLNDDHLREFIEICKGIVV